MKNVKVTINKTGFLIADGNIYEDPTEFINFNTLHNTWGKPERWVRQKESITDSNGISYIYLDEPYNDEDIIGTETRNENEVLTTYVKLKAEYTIEIIDLEKDYDWLLQECYRKRREAYPPSEEYLDAMVKGDTVAMQQYIDKCLEVKAMYPKPVKENSDANSIE